MIDVIKLLIFISNSMSISKYISFFNRKAYLLSIASVIVIDFQFKIDDLFFIFKMEIFIVYLGINNECIKLNLYMWNLNNNDFIKHIAIIHNTSTASAYDFH